MVNLYDGSFRIEIFLTAKEENAFINEECSGKNILCT